MITDIIDLYREFLKNKNKKYVLYYFDDGYYFRKTLSPHSIYNIKVSRDIYLSINSIIQSDKYLINIEIIHQLALPKLRQLKLDRIWKMT